jgi:hypothetical protein
MQKQRGDLPELAFGGFLVVLAAVALVATSALKPGSAADMGPGYVPRGLASIILAFGVLLVGRAFLVARRPLPGTRLRPLLMILAALAVFAVLLPRVGLVFTALATVACATPAASDWRWRESVPFAVALAAVSVFLFVHGLGLPVPVWPRW